MSIDYRPRSESDRAALRALCLSALQERDLTEPDDLERVLWAPGTFSTVADHGGELVGAIVGSLFDDEGEPSAAVTVIAVAERARRQGVGASLLDRFEQDAAAAHAVQAWSGGGQPRFWWPGIHEDDGVVIAFFTACGFENDDIAPNMDVDLSTADLDERSTGDIDIHRLTVAEWPAFAEWMRSTWEDPWDGEAETALLRTPVSCHVAKQNGRYVGFAAYDTNHLRWFGPMGTDPAMRGTGLGAELLRRCLRDYVARGETHCEIGWVGPAEFYTKVVGATDGRHFVRMRKALERDRRPS